MDLESLQPDWVIWLASVSLIIVLVILIAHLFKRTSRGKLNVVLAHLKQAGKDHRKSQRALAKAEKKLRRLMARAARVKPRVLQEAKETVEDARAMTGILNDKVMVAENNVRRVILDEFPPVRHQRMRDKYLPQDEKDTRPTSF